MRNSPCAIEVRQLSHWFVNEKGSHLAITNLDLKIQEGQFVCIVGPSGCGKTTLLNIVSGQISPERGEVRVTIPTDSTQRAHVIGYMPARDSLIPWRTIADNVAFGLELSGVPKRPRRNHADDLLALVGLKGKGDLLPKQLSHGMRQRANLARTLAVDPQILLVDEPFGALDAQTKARLQAEFTKIWEATRKTVLFVTHDLSEACILADRIIVMKEGKLIDDVPVSFPRPRDVLELRFEPAHQALVKSLWEEISNGEEGDT